MTDFVAGQRGDNQAYALITDGVTYRSWTDGHAIGFQAEHNDGRVEYIYLNPSQDSDDNVPNVFLYHGTEADPSQDQPLVHVDLFQEEA